LHIPIALPQEIRFISELEAPPSYPGETGCELGLPPSLVAVNSGEEEARVKLDFFSTDVMVCESRGLA
jgi:hypothetical protein